MADDNNGFVPVFATGQRLYFDWARAALEDACIPYFAREYNAAGLRLALPVFPTAGPGVSWTIWVPDNIAPAAVEQIEALPFDKQPVPRVWDFCARPNVVKFWRMLIVVGIVVLLLSVGMDLLLLWLRR